MSCNSDYLEADAYEVELSRVACLLEELDGKQINPSHWRGYHPVVYNRSSKVDGDLMVSDLCTQLQVLDVSKQSLEMQMWWRDHQAADRARILAEIKAKKDEKDRSAAISKLTPYELDLLGLKAQ